MGTRYFGELWLVRVGFGSGGLLFRGRRKVVCGGATVGIWLRMVAW